MTETSDLFLLSALLQSVGAVPAFEQTCKPGVTYSTPGHLSNLQVLEEGGWRYGMAGVVGEWKEDGWREGRQKG